MSGNGRTLALRRAAEKTTQTGASKLEDYTKYLKENAQKWGLNPDAVNDNTMLVRVAGNEYSYDVANTGNISTIKTLNNSERARQDNTNIKEYLSKNKNAAFDDMDDFVKVLYNTLPEKLKMEAITKNYNGQHDFSADFVKRAENALLEYAYGGKLTKRLLDSNEEYVKKLSEALQDGALKFTNARIKDKNNELLERISNGVIRYLDVRAKADKTSDKTERKSVWAELEPSSQSIFAQDDIERNIALFISRAMKGQKTETVKEFFKNLAKEADELSKLDQTGGGFFPEEHQNKKKNFNKIIIDELNHTDPEIWGDKTTDVKKDQYGNLVKGNLYVAYENENTGFIHTKNDVKEEPKKTSVKEEQLSKKGLKLQFELDGAKYQTLTIDNKTDFYCDGEKVNQGIYRNAKNKYDVKVKNEKEQNKKRAQEDKEKAEREAFESKLTDTQKRMLTEIPDEVSAVKKAGEEEFVEKEKITTDEKVKFVPEEINDVSSIKFYRKTEDGTKRYFTLLQRDGKKLFFEVSKDVYEKSMKDPRISKNPDAQDHKSKGEYNDNIGADDSRRAKEEIENKLLEKIDGEENEEFTNVDNNNIRNVSGEKQGENEKNVKFEEKDTERSKEEQKKADLELVKKAVKEKPKTLYEQYRYDYMCHIPDEIRGIRDVAGITAKFFNRSFADIRNDYSEAESRGIDDGLKYLAKQWGQPEEKIIGFLNSIQKKTDAVIGENGLTAQIRGWNTVKSAAIGRSRSGVKSFSGEDGEASLFGRFDGYDEKESVTQKQLRKRKIEEKKAQQRMETDLVRENKGGLRPEETAMLGRRMSKWSRLLYGEDPTGNKSFYKKQHDLIEVVAKGIDELGVKILHETGHADVAKYKNAIDAIQRFDFEKLSEDEETGLLLIRFPNCWSTELKPVKMTMVILTMEFIYQQVGFQREI